MTNEPKNRPLSAQVDPFGSIPPDVDLQELQAWIVAEDDELLVVNKPGWLVCHPSKRGPLSSLVGAVRAYTGNDTVHLVSRLDRETSGIVLFAKTKATATKYQSAIQHHRVTKKYFAVLSGELAEPVEVRRPIGKSHRSLVRLKMQVQPTSTLQSACTLFRPLVARPDITFCEIRPLTGRRHQIRVHAEWIGHPVLGDKLYGPDETLFLEFAERGWTPRCAEHLPMKRQALHCYRYEFHFDDETVSFQANIPSDLTTFLESVQLNVSPFLTSG